MRNSYFAQSRGGHFALFNFLWKLGPYTFWGIRQIRIQKPFPYLKIVYANFSAKMPTGLRYCVFPDLSTTASAVMSPEQLPAVGVSYISAYKGLTDPV